MPNPCYPVILPPSLRPHVFRPIRRHTHVSTHHVPGRGTGAHHAASAPSHTGAPSGAHAPGVPRPGVVYDCVRTPGALPPGPGVVGSPVGAGSGIAAGALSAAKAAAVAGLLGLAGAGAYGAGGGGSGFFGPGSAAVSDAAVPGAVQPGGAGPVMDMAGPGSPGVLPSSPGTGFPMLPGPGPEVGPPPGPTMTGPPPGSPVPQAPAGETLPPAEIPEPATIWVVLAALAMAACVRLRRRSA